MDIVLSVCLGIGLSAACGFRVFVPLLVMSVASLAGRLDLAPAFDWIGTYPALVAFGVATLVEIAAYYIPWVDNVLDTIATPVAVVAGIVVMASCVTGMSPYLKWILAVVAGGGVAGVVQGLTVAVRGTSTSTTGGLGNPVVASTEAGASFGVSILSVVIPVVTAVAVLAVVVLIAMRASRRGHARLA
jgi:hypothetical protein